MLFWLLPPDETGSFLAVLDGHFIKIGDLGMRSLNAAQPHPHFAAILQLTFRDALLQSGKSFFDLGHKAAADGFLFLLPPRRTAEDIGLLPTQNLDLLDLYVRTIFSNSSFNNSAANCLSLLRVVPTRYPKYSNKRSRDSSPRDPRPFG